MPKITKAKETPAQKIKSLEKELEDKHLRNPLFNEAVDIIDVIYGAGHRKYLLSQGGEKFSKTESNEFKSCL